MVCAEEKNKLVTFLCARLLDRAGFAWGGLDVVPGESAGGTGVGLVGQTGPEDQGTSGYGTGVRACVVGGAVTVDGDAARRQRTGHRLDQHRCIHNLKPMDARVAADTAVL